MVLGEGEANYIKGVFPFKRMPEVRVDEVAPVKGFTPTPTKEPMKPWENPVYASPVKAGVGPTSPIGIQLLVDDVVRLVAARGEMSLDELAKTCGWKTVHLEQVLKLLENRGVIKLSYPASLIQGPKVSVVRKLDESILPTPPGEMIEQYSFSADNVKADVKVVELISDHRPFYSLYVQTFGPYTQEILEELRERVASTISIETIDLADVEQAQALKDQFALAARGELATIFKGMGEDVLNSLAGHMLHSLYGLGELELMMADNNLEEIAINSAKSPVTVYHRKYGWMKTNLVMPTEEHIQNLASQIARKNGREITNLNPVLDAHLLSGDRVNATLFPVSSNGNTITIRRFARIPWTIIDFIGKEHTMNSEMAAWLWLAMQYELSIIVAGSTASGKTSALNALAAFIPAHQRIITIEDVREINLPGYMKWNWVPLTTRNPNPEGAGEVTMLDLLLSSLRMRPDRLIVGEMRTRAEAETLFEAVHTGHSVYATLHADSAHQVLRRLTEPPISVPALEVESIDLILVQYRDRKNNVRRTYELSEVEGGTSNEQLSAQDIFRWNPRGDAFEKLVEPVRLIQKLNLHTGMTEREIQEEVTERMTILEWMVAHDYGSISQVGRIMREFYADPSKVKSAAKQNQDPRIIFGPEEEE
ncbi:MAG: type II/IV secretion system ATPase subunit [archaeon]